MLLKQALRLYKARFKTIIPLSILSFSAIMLSDAVTPKGSGSGLSALAGILSFVVTYLTSIALMYAVSDTQADEENYLTYYQHAWNIIVQYTWLSLVVSCVVMAGIALAIIPGIILAIYFCFALYIVAFENLKGLPALTQSYNYVKGNWWGIFGRILFLMICVIFISFVFALLIFILLGDTVIAAVIGEFFQTFFIIPFGIGFLYILYSEVRGLKAGPIIETDVVRTRKLIVITVIVGVVVVFAYSIFFGPYLKKAYEKLESEQTSASLQK